MSTDPPRTAPADVFGLVGTTLEGRYRVDRVVAQGGFGVVYEGHHNGLEVPVAVKVLETSRRLPDAERARFVEQFLREAATIARLKHPHIVAAYDVGESPMPSGGSAPWMILEWLTGVTLADDLGARRARGEAGRPPAEALALLRPVIEAVAHAHDAGIAHRDLKPANIMLARARRGVVPYVLDFGIAKAMEVDDEAGSGATQTASAAQSFSPRYAAPEQVAGTRTGPWTDVHALALVLTEVLTGEEPYSARSRAALYAQVLSVDRPTPRSKGVDVGPLEAVLARALDFRPDARHRSAGELLEALDAALQTPAPTPLHVSEPAPPDARPEIAPDTPPAPPAPPASPASPAPPAPPASPAPPAPLAPVALALDAAPAPVTAPPPRRVGTLLVGLAALATVAGAAWIAASMRRAAPVVAPSHAPAPPLTTQPERATPTLARDVTVAAAPAAQPASDAATPTPAAHDAAAGVRARAAPPVTPRRRPTARDAGRTPAPGPSLDPEWNPG